MSQELSDLALALLRMLYRSEQGGPVPTHSSLFTEAYRELESHDLIADGRITQKGETILREHYADP